MTTMLFLATVALGCSKKDENSDNKASTKNPPPAAAAPLTAKAVEETPTNTEPEVGAAVEAAVPTVADFEAEAITTISDKTLEEDLAAIEKDLGE